MQKVTVEKWSSGAGTSRIADGEAEFMAWGVEFEELRDGVGSFSTAIIKRDDGSIENVDCILIKFVS